MATHNMHRNFSNVAYLVHGVFLMLLNLDVTYFL